MKTLQNDYTTPEQSKRLLELGVPKWTANYKYGYIGSCSGEIILDTETVQSYKELFEGEIPLWSLGRLVEIELKCREEREGYTPRLRFSYLETPNKKDGRTLIENFVRYMTEGPYKYDFTKLDKNETI